ncbi:MAG: diguanylate cyclase [Methylococcales bacterium]|nr:diguanylate cyclase [Methylococcales bacterium]
MSSGLQLYTNYRNDIFDIEKEMQQIEQSYLSSLTNSLWQLDDQQINIQLQGILALPNVGFIAIIEGDNKTLYEKGFLLTNNFVQHTYDIVYKNGQLHQLGRLNVMFSLQKVYDSLEQQFWIILISKMIQTFCVSLFIIGIFYRLIAKHLHKMASYAENLTFNSLDTPLILDKVNRNDELDRVSVAINKMRISLTDSKQKLDEQQHRQQQILELMPAAVFVTDANGCPTYVNQRAKEIFGDGIIQNSTFSELSAVCHAYISGTNRLYLSEKQVITQALAGRKSYCDDMEIKPKTSANRIPLEAWGSPVFNQQNEVTAAIAVFQDITERKQAEESRIQLAQAEEAEIIATRLSMTDELTQLYNRRYFNIEFPKEIQRAARTSQMISFLILNIDYFKLYNDGYGHQKGDEVLCEIGQILKAQCQRAGDIPIRLGGEEFGIIFSGLTSQQALNFANRIKTTIQNAKIEHNFSGVDPYVTASFGLVTSAAGIRLTQMELYKQADQALYQAKHRGRNQVFQICI